MYFVQVGRYRGSYKTRYSFESENRALMWYNGINVGRGYKKRIVKNGKVLARVITNRWD